MLSSLNNFLNRFRDFGILLLRLGIGTMFLFHGWPLISGGPEKWQFLGKAMQNLGINFGFTFWGFMAAFSEFGGAILLIFGFLFRPAAFLLLITMIVATVFHFHKGDPFSVASHAIELGIVFLSLIFIGPGKYSVDKN